MSVIKIAVAGIGYVGLSNAILLAQNNQVAAVDVDPERVAQINAGQCPIVDAELEGFLRDKALRLTATIDAAQAYAGADFVVVATPTNYDPVENYFDTSSVEAVIRAVVAVNDHATIVIKSTVPVGYTARISAQIDGDRVIFSPEFLREGRALHDNLYPSRIIVGERSARAETFARSWLKAHCGKTYRFSTQIPLRPRRSSSSPIHTSPCAWPISTNSTAMR